MSEYRQYDFYLSHMGFSTILISLNYTYFWIYFIVKAQNRQFYLHFVESVTRMGNVFFMIEFYIYSVGFLEHLLIASISNGCSNYVLISAQVTKIALRGW